MLQEEIVEVNVLYKNVSAALFEHLQWTDVKGNVKKEKKIQSIIIIIELTNLLVPPTIF